MLDLLLKLLKMWEWSFRARCPSKTDYFKLAKRRLKRHLQCGVDARVICPTCLAPAARQTFPIHLPRHLLCCKTQSVRFCRVCASAISQKRVSCEPSLKKWKSKMWKPRFCARLLSKAASRRCGIEAFERDFPQKLQVEDMETKLSC